MRLLPMMLAAALLGGCGEDVDVEIAGRAAQLARTVAAEQDHVSVPELADWLVKDQRDYELLDIRDAEEFSAGHIDTARSQPLAALLSEASLATLPEGRKVVVYSNGTAHAAQAVLLLRLVGRDAYALLGGFNYWQAWLHDPQAAGVAQMDTAQAARYQAVACYLEGDYVASAGLAPRTGTPVATVAETAQPASGAADPLGLGLGLGLGPETDTAAQSTVPAAAVQQGADPLGLGLGLGLGGEAAESLQQQEAAPPQPETRKLLIKAEC